MPAMSRTLIVCLLCTGFVGCQPAYNPAPAATDTTPSASAPAEPAPEPTAPIASDGEIGYRCNDGGSLAARYGDSSATLRWPDGRSETLPRAESASRGGGDVYVGATVSLQRDGDRIELHDGDKPATTCTASRT